MKKGLLRTSLSIVFAITLLFVGINYYSFAVEPSVTLEEDIITLYAGADATEEDKYFQFTLKVKGVAISDCTWSLSDDTYLTVDNNGLVKLKDDISNKIDITSVTLTVRNASTSASDTALIFIETSPPLGAVTITNNMYKEQFMEPNIFIVVPAKDTKIMTKIMFKEQYMEPTLDPVVIPSKIKKVMKVQFNSFEFLEKY